MIINTIKLYLAAIVYYLDIVDFIVAAREKIHYVYRTYQIKYWICQAAYQVGKELKFQNFNFTAKFEDSSENDIAAWTDISHEKICVHFYIQDILDTWFLLNANPTCPPTISFGEFITRLTRHELRHVWQAQNCFAMFLLDGQLPYDIQIREADANQFALGLGSATPEEFNETVETTLRAWNLL